MIDIRDRRTTEDQCPGFRRQRVRIQKKSFSFLITLAYLGEDHVHGVGPVLRVHVVQGEHVPPVGRELVAKEPRYRGLCIYIVQIYSSSNPNLDIPIVHQQYTRYTSGDDHSIPESLRKKIHQKAQT